ncbi:MAG: hypothetical protein WD875_06960 [Pirellulales bacterium]
MLARIHRVLRGLMLTGSTLLAVGALAGSATGQDVEFAIAPPALQIEIAPGDGPAFAMPLIINGGDGGGLFFSQPWSTDPSSLLDQGNVQQELELLDDQREKIRDAQRQMQEQMQKRFAEMREQHQQRIRETQQRDGGNPGGINPGGGIAPRIAAPSVDLQNTQEVMKELREELAKKIDDVLLPHQKKRLEEISLRMKMKQRGTSGSLVDTELAKTLDIDDAQKERIRRKANEVQQRLEEEFAKLREEARKEILDELSPAQKRKLEDLIGADFADRPKPIVRQRIGGRPPPAVKKVEPKVEQPAEDDAADDDAAGSDAGENRQH